MSEHWLKSWHQKATVHCQSDDPVYWLFVQDISVSSNVRSTMLFVTVLNIRVSTRSHDTSKHEKLPCVSQIYITSPTGIICGVQSYIHTYMFVVVNFDALAQANDIQIERRQIVFLCWMQDLDPGSQTPNRQQTECSLTNRLSYRGSSLKLELDSPSLWSASIHPTWPHCQLTFAPGSGDIHVFCC